MGGAVARVTLEELAARAVQEREDQRVLLGQVERPFDGVLRGLRLAERVAGHGLQDQRADQDDHAVNGGGPAERRGQHVGGGGRVALGEREPGPHFPEFAQVTLGLGEFGKRLPDGGDLAHLEHGVQCRAAQLRLQGCAGDEQELEPVGVAEARHRVRDPAPGQVHTAVGQVQHEAHGRLEIGADRPVGPGQALLGLVEPARLHQRRRLRDQGRPDHRVGAPAVAFGQRDRLPGGAARPRERAPG